MRPRLRIGCTASVGQLAKWILSGRRLAKTSCVAAVQTPATFAPRRAFFVRSHATRRRRSLAADVCDLCSYILANFFCCFLSLEAAFTRLRPHSSVQTSTSVCTSLASNSSSTSPKRQVTREHFNCNRICLLPILFCCIFFVSEFSLQRIKLDC